MPAHLKPAALRQRKNRRTTAAVLPTEESMQGSTVPDLPGREDGWHPRVLEWWADVWRSPMASQYVQSDISGGLEELALLRQAYREKPCAALAAEIRLQDVRFGLSPLDRARLHWEIDKGDQAEERVTKRRTSAQTRKDNGGTDDPRVLLKLG